MISLTDRIGDGWPEPEVVICDKCYRRSLAAPDGCQATLEGWA